MQARGLGQQAEVEAPQPLAPRRGPVLVPVLRQEVTAIEGNRLLIGTRILCAASGSGGDLEGGGVDPQLAVGPERQHLALPPQRLSRRRNGRREGAAGDVEHVPQVVAGGGGVEVRPEQVEQLVAVEGVVGGQRQQLHQRARLAQSPGPVVDRPCPDLDAKAAEELDAERQLLSVTLLNRRPAMLPDNHLLWMGLLAAHGPPHVVQLYL